MMIVGPREVEGGFSKLHEGFLEVVRDGGMEG